MTVWLCWVEFVVLLTGVCRAKERRNEGEERVGEKGKEVKEGRTRGKRCID